MAYRPDIDGLRAIAVLSVFLHHLNPALLPGGFIGVDIFFVISGYLITLQIFRESRAGSFSIAHFYKRRINRIIPALLTVNVATLAAGMFLLSPEDLVRLGKSALLAMLGLSNFFFWHTYGNYFAGNAAEAPLLHTWSLGVEEQFYLVWPLLLLLMLRGAGRFLLPALLVLAAAALAVSELGTGIMASASYYLLPTRFFELMAGGLLALLLADADPAAIRFPRACMLTGLALIGAALVVLDPASPFPDLNAVWPGAGAALLILGGGAPHGGPLARLLTLRPLVFVGAISYSLYLWHWPIIACLRYLDIDIGLAVGIAVSLAATCLAWLSWRFVECPMRRSGALLSVPRVFMLRFAVPVLSLFLAGGAISYSEGVPQRFDPKVAQLERMSAARPEELRHGCHVPPAMYAAPPAGHCRLGARGARADAILIGDSFANHFTGMVDVMAAARRFSVVDYTMDGCPPILGYHNGKRGAYAEKCIKRNEAAFALIASRRYAHVILAGQWPRDEDAGRKMTESADAILGSGAKLTLIMSNESIRGAASCTVRRLMFDARRGCEGGRQAPPHYFAALLARHPQIKVIDPNQVICRADKCSPVLNDKLLYRDDVHLNDIGSREIGRELLARRVAL